MQPTTKKILLVLGLGFIAAYIYKKYQEDGSITQQSTIPQNNTNDTNALPVQSDKEFVKVGEECQLIGSIKDCFNHFKGFEAYKPTNTYDQETLDNFKLLMNGTENIFDENYNIRRSFFYDFCLVVANSANTDIPPCDCQLEKITSLVVLGDKSLDVANLQQLINYIYAPIDDLEHVNVNATYDKQTLEEVQKLFKGVTGMVDYNKGALSAEFIKNFLLIVNNLKSNNNSN
jgi:hypothetical protein